MEKTIQPFFIYNDEIKDSNEFNKNLIQGLNIYEVIRVIKGVPLFLEDHLERMENSFKITGLTLPISTERIIERINLLISKNSYVDGNIKFLFKFEKNFNNLSKATFYAYYIKHYYPTKDKVLFGVDTVLFEGTRDNPHAKIIDNNLRNKINEILMNSNVYEVILLDRNAFITEGSRSNLFFVKNNSLYTAPLADVLPGITRGYIIDIAKSLNYDVIEKPIHLNELNMFDGVFLTGTSPKVLPIKTIDDIKYKSANNEVIINLIKKYDEVIKNYIYLQKK
ncbi:aminotransferase, class IV [Candidatus Syntrophocurvum alkaliphilum]|uniref:Aminotransferase, class IV n=1 Tax=Candidatus Syntrophocurvum alkaliphilum TaxID=2293317 RepID=A0A6I6D8X3_9FIRM|nr:aminotransferase class IV [Candidatus Syntrophocurvum alkaliphilum]QGT99388.1 aminotransferase, class IV [Candidatus Syntrophocurvum alkaliphilum]